MYTIRWIESSSHKPSPWSLDCWCTWMMILCMLLTYEAKAQAEAAANCTHLNRESTAWGLQSISASGAGCAIQTRLIESSITIIGILKGTSINF